MSSSAPSVAQQMEVISPPGLPMDGPRRLSLVRRIYELSDDNTRLKSMEGLRGLAVMMVFFVHFHALFGDFARQSVMLWEPSHFLGIVGNTGVDLFFVLSGYLIYGALVRKSVGIIAFLRRRVTRIYPTFLAVFSLYIVLSFVFPESSKLTRYHGFGRVIYIVQNLLLLPGLFDIKPMITLAWTLSYEFFFYVSVALLIAGTRMWAWSPKIRAIFFAIVWCGYMLVCFSVPKSHVRALMFVVGILLYEALSNETFRRRLNRSCEIVAIVMFLASIAFIYFMDVRKDLFAFLPGWLAGRNEAPGVLAYQGPYKTIVLSISIFWCAAYCFAFDGTLKRVFSWTPFRYLGNMSYSYYLIHGVTLQGVAMASTMIAARGVSGTPLFFGGLLIGFALTWVCSTLLFLGVEGPFSLHRKCAWIRFAAR